MVCLGSWGQGKGAVRSLVSFFFFFAVVDEQNRHTQVHRMWSSSSIKRENSEELKDADMRTCKAKSFCPPMTCLVIGGVGHFESWEPHLLLTTRAALMSMFGSVGRNS